MDYKAIRDKYRKKELKIDSEISEAESDIEELEAKIQELRASRESWLEGLLRPFWEEVEKELGDNYIFCGDPYTAEGAWGRCHITFMYKDRSVTHKATFQFSNRNIPDLYFETGRTTGNRAYHDGYEVVKVESVAQVVSLIKRHILKLNDGFYEEVILYKVTDEDMGRKEVRYFENKAEAKLVNHSATSKPKIESVDAIKVGDEYYLYTDIRVEDSNG